MTLSDLKRVAPAKRQLIAMRQRIAKVEAALKSPVTYTIGGVKITTAYGRTLESSFAYLEKLKHIYVQRLIELEEHVKYVSEWIMAIEDPITSEAFYNRYILGHTWEQVSYKVRGNTPDSLRMRCSRYLQKEG